MGEQIANDHPRLAATRVPRELHWACWRQLHGSAHSHVCARQPHICPGCAFAPRAERDRMGRQRLARQRQRLASTHGRNERGARALAPRRSKQPLRNASETHSAVNMHQQWMLSSSLAECRCSCSSCRASAIPRTTATGRSRRLRKSTVRPNNYGHLPYNMPRPPRMAQALTPWGMPSATAQPTRYLTATGAAAMARRSS